MNQRIGLVGRVGLLAVVAMALLLFGLGPPEAKGQVTPTSINVATNVPAAVTTAMASNITTYIPVRQGKSLNIQVRFALSGSGTDANLFYFYPRVDGTNVATLHPHIMSSAGNGTTQVVDWTNIPATSLQGVTDLAFTVCSNATARTLFFTNLVYSYAN